jgi:hypothetical protein
VRLSCQCEGPVKPGVAGRLHAPQEYGCFGLSGSFALADTLDRVPEDGAPIQACYDLMHHRPSPAYEKIYLSVKADLARLGLAFA